MATSGRFASPIDLQAGWSRRLSLKRWAGVARGLMSPKILIVDDDPVQCRLLEVLVHRFGYSVETAASGAAALERIADPLAPRVDLMILGLVMPGLDGMAVLSRMRGAPFAVPVIVETTHGSVEAAVAALRAGAIDFVLKPDGGERLQASIKNALRLAALEAEIGRLGRQALGGLSFADIAGQSPEMERAVRLGERAAKSTAPVLLDGEAGVGKEAFARAILAASDRRGRPFVTLACGALPADAIEAALFGQDKDASERKPGKFVEAHGGALFLDDIGNLPLQTQGKLLRALQQGEVEPVGGGRPVRADIRLIAATTDDLLERVRAGRFREDLYYRLNVHPIAIPPLRRRQGDIPALARRFCARFAAQEGKRLRGLSAGALSLLSTYDWPGNVRQLENAVFRAVVLAEGDELTVAEFPQIAAVVPGFDVRVPAAAPPRAALAPRAPELVTVEIADPNAMPLLDENGDMRKLDELEAAAIRFALVHYRGRMSAMARKLGIGRSTLYRKMKQYGLAVEAQAPGDNIPEAALAEAERREGAAA
jgi:DNA-binding NtrC family response regulator